MKRLIIITGKRGVGKSTLAEQWRGTGAHIVGEDRASRLTPEALNRQLRGVLMLVLVMEALPRDWPALQLLRSVTVTHIHIERLLN